jgi:Hsp70 protein
VQAVLWRPCRLQTVQQRDARHVLVFDLGGGTLDVVLLRQSETMLEVRPPAAHHSRSRFLCLNDVS